MFWAAWNGIDFKKMVFVLGYQNLPMPRISIVLYAPFA